MASEVTVSQVLLVPPKTAIELSNYIQLTGIIFVSMKEVIVPNIGMQLKCS